MMRLGGLKLGRLTGTAPRTIAALGLGIALLAGGATTATALHKDVQLSVDGQLRPGGAFGVTVADVLNGNGITLAAGDVVSPALTSPVSDGQVITVSYAKPLDLTVDGRTEHLVTTAATLDEVLADQAVPALAWTSVHPGAQLPRDGIAVTVSTPKDITLSVAGKKSSVTTTAVTVADLLAEKGLNPDGDDRVYPARDTVLAEGDDVRLDRVEVNTREVTESVGFSTTKRKSTSLWAGESRVVTSGKKGKANRTYRVTTVNGKLDKQVIVRESMLTKPVDAVIEVGTKTTSNGAGLNLARAGMWDRIARCESGGNWRINTGNGYYGGLQFNLASWRSNGGRDFAARPDLASRAEQITVANRYYAKAGTSPWSCA
ncbi:MAG: transglycosylase family protein [Propionibacteriaceae bacterium]|jgi:uncharacterized protein YabE (DUF348 family)|nr:transglycosylase family protein [Propionibacteriaceae bacterium]